MIKPKLNVVLYEPAIPQNTGSIARLCACTGCVLHLIHPLGFSIDERSVRRAGLDYWPHVEVKEHQNWPGFLNVERPKELFFLENYANKPYSEATFTTPVYLIFGNEVKGIPKQLHEEYPSSFFTIPMRTQLVRSLNLAQSVAIVVYEALRQNNFPI